MGPANARRDLRSKKRTTLTERNSARPRQPVKARSRCFPDRNQTWRAVAPLARCSWAMSRSKFYLRSTRAGTPFESVHRRGCTIVQKCAPEPQQRPQPALPRSSSCSTLVYVIAQDTPRVESFNKTHPPNVENVNLFRSRSPTPRRDVRCG